MRNVWYAFRPVALSAGCLLTLIWTVGCARHPGAAKAGPQCPVATPDVPVAAATAPSPTTAPATAPTEPAPEGQLSRGSRGRIAFCCDASGSMIDKFVTLKEELEKAIEGLRPTQSFSLRFFGHDGRVDA